MNRSFNHAAVVIVALTAAAVAYWIICEPVWTHHEKVPRAPSNKYVANAMYVALLLYLDDKPVSDEELKGFQSWVDDPRKSSGLTVVERTVVKEVLHRSSIKVRAAVQGKRLNQLTSEPLIALDPPTSSGLSGVASGGQALFDKTNKL